jgi:hypothetical protein
MRMDSTSARFVGRCVVKKAGEKFMNYVTFKIIETPSGEFVLFLHNHSKKLVSEQFRSKNLDEVVNRLEGGMEYRKRFMNALGNYMPVLKIIDDLTEKYSGGLAEEFPEGWTDPLELYGSCAQELITPKFDREKERYDLLSLLEKHSSEWVWKNRRRLVAERIFIQSF